MKHLQTSDVRKLFRQCRNIDISPENAADVIIEYINNNYTLKETPKDNISLRLQEEAELQEQAQWDFEDEIDNYTGGGL